MPRRHFLTAAALMAACRTRVISSTPATTRCPTPSVAPTGEETGISARTLAEAEKLFGIEYTAAERALLLEVLDDQIARAVQLRAIDLPNALAPATIFDPRPSGFRMPVCPSPGTSSPGHARVGARRPRAPASTASSPTDDESIAFAPVTQLAAWLERRELTSVQLTELYLSRLETLGEQLECVVTSTPQLAMQQARAADERAKAGKRASALDGIPWGAKDLFATRGIPTTWGAEPYRDQIPQDDAVVVRRLHDAGAVLVAKLSLGALAYGDVWFDGITRNPWDMREGSSGSSAGSAAATAAGLVGFALGTETLGSIVSPSMRCGTTGLRPTFGRVARTGAMSLCWSLDKIGPITRFVEDASLVLQSIQGSDAGDPSSIDAAYCFDRDTDIGQLRVGYIPAWFDSDDADEVDRAVLAALRELGVRLIEMPTPSFETTGLLTILSVEAAAAFEQITLDGRDDALRWQAAEAWPNTFRAARFVSAIELVQAERVRRRLMTSVERLFSGIDVLAGPSFAGDMLLVTNFTGHPCLTMRAGFASRPAEALRVPSPDAAEKNVSSTPNEPAGTAQLASTPRGFTLWGRLFGESALIRLGIALERKLDVASKRPPAVVKAASLG